MSRVVIFVVLLLVFCVACDGSASAGTPSASRVSGPPAAIVATSSAPEVPLSATTTAGVKEQSAQERPPAIRVPPKVLATSWPSYVGRRVSFSCRPVRRVDFVRTMAVADGETAPLLRTG